MSNVLIEKNKLDILATAISNKSGEPLKLTLDEMVEAVDGIEIGGGTPTLETVTKTYTPSASAVTDTITPSSGYDGIEEVDVTVSAIPIASPYIYATAEYSTENNNRVWKTRGAVSVDNVEGDNEGYINEGTYYGNYYTYNAIATGTSVTPTESAQTIGGANTMMEGAVTVNPIPYADGDNEAYGHGEIWLINATPTVLQSKNWNVDFISNGNIYIKISLGYVMEYPQVIYAKNSNTEVYFNGTWTSQAYRTIEITGGTDKDNAEFRAWLEANAVRQ